MGGSGDIYADAFDGIRLLDEGVQASFFELVALAPTIERRHRRFALVRELTAHLVREAPTWK